MCTLLAKMFDYVVTCVRQGENGEGNEQAMGVVKVGVGPVYLERVHLVKSGNRRETNFHETGTISIIE